MEDYPSNETKAALKRGETLMIAEINRIFDPAVVELAAQAGFGCTWIDMEHSHLDLGALASMVLAARTVDIDVVVRIPKGPYNQVIKPLELGAGGLVWPHCKSANEAAAFVEMAKFQPLGKRGCGGGRDSRYGTLDFVEYTTKANAETLLGVMIEDAEGVEDVDYEMALCADLLNAVLPTASGTNTAMHLCHAHFDHRHGTERSLRFDHAGPVQNTHRHNFAGIRHAGSRWFEFAGRLPAKRAAGPWLHRPLRPAGGNPD